MDKLNPIFDGDIISRNDKNVKAEKPEKPEKTFDGLKRDYEKALASGTDTSTAMTALATAVVYSVLNTCIDPQRKSAVKRADISNSAANPTMITLKRGVYTDLQLLDTTRHCMDNATRLTYDKNGDLIRETVDEKLAKAAEKIVSQTLTDGMDLVQEACIALLAETERAEKERTTYGDWLDTPYTVRRLSRRVYIQETESAAYKDIETTPIQEVYRTVRCAIANSRAVQADPVSGYTYLESYTADDLEKIYYRLDKYTDLGSYDSMGNYTVGSSTVRTYTETLRLLNLTDRQLTVLKLRMRGYGYKAIATYLGVTPRAVAKTCEKIRKRATDIGFTPDLWNEMNSGENNDSDENND